MSFQIERGLFKFSDCGDHHAVLGVPINADANQVRKRYLKITRSLHPDSRKIKDEASKKLASEILSKLVNPAYEQLYKDKSRRQEYQMVLTQMGKRLATEGSGASIASEVAQDLSRAGANIESSYRNALQSLAVEQYSSLDQVLERIAQISELNLVYLMRTQGKGMKAPQKAPASKSAAPKSATKEASSQQQTSAPEKQTISPVDNYIRRAKGYIDKNSFSKAVLELRDAIKLEPTNGVCHALIGWAYLKQNQQGMARVHIKKAWQVNEQDPTIIKVKNAYEKITKEKIIPETKKPEATQTSGSGILGGLFGGRRK